MYLSNIELIQFLPDFINLIFLSAIIFLLCIKYKINKKYFYLFTIFLFTPFLFYYMWDWSFLPDQSKYADRVFRFRNFNYNEGFLELFKQKINFSSLLLAFFPIPFVTSIVSIALINKGILIMTAIYFISKKNYFFIVLLLIFLPSMIVISSVALREMIVISIGILFVFFLVEKNYLKFFILGILFLLTKTELAIIFIFILVTYFIIFEKFKLNKINIKFLTIFCIILLGFVCIFIFFQDILLEKKEGFFLEEVGYAYSIYANFDLDFFNIMLSVSKFWLSPLSTESLNLINSIIFIENIFIYYLLCLLLIRINRENQAKALFWLLVWIMLGAVLGYTIENAGTIWRYKFTMQIIFLCMVYFSIKNKKNIPVSIINND